jgi:putative tricarboxylic transport membrane protein
MSGQESSAGTPPRHGTDRVAGAALAIAGLAIALEATTFEVAFLTDPVGPKALPLVAAVILFAAGATLLLRPRASSPWPSAPVLGRMAGATGVFLAYALVLEPMGFVLATTGTMAALSRLFGGAWLKSVVAAFALSVVLWYLFVWVLGLPLPMGLLWTP